jgi:hypothetical protein
MGLEIIKDTSIRKNWEQFMDYAYVEFQKKGIDLQFNNFKYDGSYAKAKGPLPAVNFAFAQDSKRTWVELELKPRTVKGKRYSQDDLYLNLKKNCKMKNSKAFSEITWNEEDIEQTPRSPAGKDIRIKIYLNSDDKELWVSSMCRLVDIFMPMLVKYKNA